MQEFSTVDGFLEVTEDLADMIKYVANEPSVGLFFVQKHIQNATPNLVNLKNNVVEKSHETVLHTEDLEDCVTMMRSMKECGFPIAEEMIGEIKKSLTIMSHKQPRKGLLSSSGSGFVGRTSSWSPATFGSNSIFPRDSEKNGGYFSGVFKSAKQKVTNLKWPQVESKESRKSEDGNLPSPTSSNPKESHLTVPEAQGEDTLTSQDGNKQLQEEPRLSTSLSHQALLSLYDNFDEFKADREAKLEEWLGGVAGDEEHHKEKK
ncbi:hypothetical protein F511_01735 [Dorcoceras hygrometricum]|uniref:Uncharacterized protein n=1 Tax=Dorcoceras hygrometricum TaxID=472368 RepID=A0A2Z7AS11_9LAMI|nr:hypothetical protein F511_01735 [Dorcoceras hygrometricum]